MRIVALSDQHGFLPDVPPCDLLIVAGDVCPDWIGKADAEREPARQKDWFDEHARRWLAAAPAAHRILTWGNHDWCGQACDFGADSPENAPSCALQIVVDCSSWVPSTGDSGRSISVWATPWSRLFMNWAFMKPETGLAEVYEAIPAGIDILVTHQPPYGYGDRVTNARPGEEEHLGSHELLSAIERIKPRLVICGHIHSGHGYFEHAGIPIYNVSVVNDHYELVRSPTVIDIEHW